MPQPQLSHQWTTALELTFFSRRRAQPKEEVMVMAPIPGTITSTTMPSTITSRGATTEAFFKASEDLEADGDQDKQMLS